jgi:hypothetical protein
MAASINDYDFLVDKMKDLEWAIFFASLTPEEFGRVIAHVNLEFAQPRVGALLARNYGGDFTCAHCGAAIQNTAQVFRSNMVEGLLAYCVDLSENNHLVRGQLSEFEQIIVALHALDERERPPQRAKSFSAVKRTSSRGPLRPTRSSKVGNKPEDSVTPEEADICMNDNKHQGTKEFFHFVKHVATHDESPQFCPAVFRRIKRKFKDRRFLIRPFQEMPYYWREASKREQIEFVGNAFDNEKLRQIAASQQKEEAAMRNGQDPKGDGKKWAKRLRESASEWDLVMTIHSYASAIEDEQQEEEKEEEEDQGPTAIDICFDKPDQAGNAALVRAVRRSLQDSTETDFSPPMYRSIKGHLRGRRFFTKVGEGEWREATQQERRQHIGNIFEEEKALKQKKRRPSVSSSTSSLPSGESSLEGVANGGSPKRVIPQRRAAKRDSYSSHRQKPKMSMKHPRDFDVCYGLEGHPGTTMLHTAVMDAVLQFPNTEWSPPVYKFVRAQLQGRRFFIQPEKNLPWREATAPERVDRTRKEFEIARRRPIDSILIG